MQYRIDRHMPMRQFPMMPIRISHFKAVFHGESHLALANKPRSVVLSYYLACRVAPAIEPMPSSFIQGLNKTQNTQVAYPAQPTTKFTEKLKITMRTMDVVIICLASCCAVVVGLGACWCVYRRRRKRDDDEIRTIRSDALTHSHLSVSREKCADKKLSQLFEKLPKRLLDES
ncbi:hypothetical protein EVAR_41377_1 [Eumeta japonica]|uniref:Uncharacterized protein n=1 Tax=Eumeta variegata TaxID=151549 RepID=A0A4C1WXU7_EUMVA|nr:hypothetical protein EVAR_41377_1 [Eumeta japonica]